MVDLLTGLFCYSHGIRTHSGNYYDSDHDMAHP